MTDALCHKWCNPAPLDGSAPNLVVVDTDTQGRQYYKQAFNMQACQQLNAWLGEFEQILKRMTSGNFNWFLHTILVHHTSQIMERQLRMNIDDDDEGDGGDEDRISVDQYFWFQM